MAHQRTSRPTRQSWLHGWRRLGYSPRGSRLRKGSLESGRKNRSYNHAVDPIVFIPLTQGKVAVIDFDDFELVGRQQWYTQVTRKGRGPFYARRNTVNLESGARSFVLMHTVIIGSLWVDHRNGNGLDNRRINLRTATNSQNQRSVKRKSRNQRNRFRGVAWHSASNKWLAKCTVNYSQKHIGLFDSEEEAARAWDATAIKYGFSEEALNFPPPRPDDFEVL